MFREKIYMKYEIDRFKNSEVIRCFFKSEKSILIVFLDNHTVEIPYTKENEDIFVHYSAIELDGYKTLKENQLVEFKLIETSKGFQAINVRLLQETTI